MLAWYRGEFGYANKKLEVAANTLTEACTRDLEAMLFMPNDATAGLYTHLALARYIDGDLAGVAAELDRAERRCAEIPFPKGAFSLAYARQMELLIRLEAGQLHRAAEAAVELITLGEQHGFDFWALVGTAQQATVGSRISLGRQCRSGDVAATRAALTAFVEVSRSMDTISLVTLYDAILARLLIASGELPKARERLQIGLELAERTRMHFYDAELLRLRAHTTDDIGGTPRGSRGGLGLGPASGCADLPTTRRDRSFRARRCTGPARGIGRAECVFRREQLAGSRDRPGNARVRRPGGKVAIIGGGMAALSAAWRLSEPASRDRFESITVYQRGWRLGGKAASSRGPNGRIEEHGLHIWLGSYENAFALLRECYTELDRATTDPMAPIRTWEEAIAPADNPGLADSWNDNWVTWHGTHPRDDKLPGDPDSTGREITAVAFVERALRLVLAFADSLRDAAPGRLMLSASPDPPAPPLSLPLDAAMRATLATLLAVVDPQFSQAPASDVLEHALLAVRDAIDADNRVDRRRSWVLLSLVVAAVRGIIADKLITDAHGFAAINDEDFCDWIVRHGAHPDVLDSAMVRGVYDLVFGYRDGDPRRPAVGAGVMTFLYRPSAFRLPRSDFLEDDGRHGRCRDRAAVSGTAKARCEIRVLPPSRRAAPGSLAPVGRHDNDGPPSPTRRRPSTLRTAYQDSRAPGVPQTSPYRTAPNDRWAGCDGIAFRRT